MAVAVFVVAPGAVAALENGNAPLVVINRGNERTPGRTASNTSTVSFRFPSAATITGAPTST